MSGYVKTGTGFPSGVHRKAFMQLLRTLVHSRIVLVLGVAGQHPRPRADPAPPARGQPVAGAAGPAALDRRQVRPVPAALARPHRRRASSRRWHLRAYAESELLGLLTPGHVGADVWRMHRLTRGRPRPR